MIQPIEAVILGIVEGLTEYLPVSSTGHLILTARALGLQGEGVKAFEVVIQCGAIAAVLGLYRERVEAMGRGLMGRDQNGRTLLRNLTLSVLPAVAAGLLLHRTIKAHLFSAWPVVWALAVGGVAMIIADRRLRRGRPPVGRTLESVTRREALVIGLAQCLALWPGTSRAMVTMLAGMWVGLSATAAAEYSFLLALPTLGGAALLDVVSSGRALLQDAGAASVVCGFVSAAAVAALAVRGFVRYLTRHGLEPFGWYRLAAALLVWLAARP
jgi:undecaprenyl-diphosphatase